MHPAKMYSPHRLVLVLLLIAGACTAGDATPQASAARAGLYEKAQLLHYGGATNPPQPQQALQTYQLLVDTSEEQDTLTAGALCGMALILEDASPPDLLRAAQLYNASASLGNGTAQFAVATLYANGMFGFPKEEALGLLHLQYAALAGVAEAQMALGFRYAHGIGVPKRCASAVAYYELVANAAVDAMAISRDEASSQPTRLTEKHFDGFSVSSSESREEAMVNYYVNTADRGNVGAQIALGQLHYYGAQGVARDYAQAAEWFQLAVGQDSAEAMSNLGHMRLHGLGVPQDNASALALFNMAAEKEVSAARNGLGYMHLMGAGVPQSYREAKAHFTASGNSDGHYNLGVMYLKGLGVTRDFNRAFSFFSKAAQRSHMQAIHKLGQMYVHGIGTAKSCDKAVKYFVSVTKRGPWARHMDKAYNRLVDGYMDAALFGYAKAAEQGVEVAQWNAAFLLDQGLANSAVPGSSGEAGQQAGEAGEAGAAAAEGEVSDAVVAEAESRALRLLLLSSKQGFVDASVRVGDYYYYGRAGLPANPEEAATHYHTAVERRNSQAMFNLGYMHEHGVGVPVDFHLAKRFYDMAAETSPKASFATKIAVWKMRLKNWWYGGKGEPARAAAVEVEEDGDDALHISGSEEVQQAPAQPQQPKKKQSPAKKAIERARRVFTSITNVAFPSLSSLSLWQLDDGLLIGMLVFVFIVVLAWRFMRLPGVRREEPPE